MMDKWMDGELGIDEGYNEKMDSWKNGWIYGWMHLLNGWVIDGRVYKWMDGFF